LPGPQPVRGNPAGQAAAAAVLRLRQPVTVSQHINRPLLEEWIQQADYLANALPDAQSVLYRKFLTTNKPSSNGTLAELTTFAEALEPLAAELHGFGGADAGQVQTMLGQLTDAPVRLRATGLAGPPENDAPQDMQSERWWEAVNGLFQAAEDLTKASASTATAYRQLQDCKTILSTIYNHQDTGTQVWLASDGEPVAVAIYLENTNGIEVADIATCPQYLRAGIRGAGGALMEYLARLAKARNGMVSLIALDKNVKNTYSNWGFVAIGGGGTMVLEGSALDKFLATHNAFKPDG
jgi:GNAT superfamily N-acetyltransferase